MCCLLADVCFVLISNLIFYFLSIYCMIMLWLMTHCSRWVWKGPWATWRGTPALSCVCVCLCVFSEMIFKFLWCSTLRKKGLSKIDRSQRSQNSQKLTVILDNMLLAWKLVLLSPLSSCINTQQWILRKGYRGRRRERLERRRE